MITINILIFRQIIGYFPAFAKNEQQAAISSYANTSLSSCLT